MSAHFLANSYSHWLLYFKNEQYYCYLPPFNVNVLRQSPSHFALVPVLLINQNTHLSSHYPQVTGCLICIPQEKQRSGFSSLKCKRKKLIRSRQPRVSLHSPQFPKSTVSTYNVLNNESGSSITMIALRPSLIIKSGNLAHSMGDEAIQEKSLYLWLSFAVYLKLL